MNEQNETSAVAEQVTTKTTHVSGAGKYIVAVVVVAVLLLGVLYVLEREGRSSTSLFTGIIEKQYANTVVAEVDGKKITNADLATSLEQFKQMASQQGVDVASPEMQAEIRSQALDVLINTELLKQAATKKGLSVSEDELNQRIEDVTTQIGGADVLAERMASLGIDDAKLRRDIGDELLIQKLIDSLLAEQPIEITEDEISQVYENAGGAAAGLPALEEVRGEVEAQVRASKEQGVIDTYLTELKDTASIDIKDAK